MFNTWSQAPKDVETVVIKNENTNESENKDIPAINDFVNDRIQWSEEFSMNSSNNVCEGIEEAEDAEIEAKGNGETTMSNVKIWLLGNERRRDYQMRTVKMKGLSSIKDAFLESHRVSRVTLEK